MREGVYIFTNMDTLPYTKREMDEKFLDIKISLDRIEAQTKRTNGRVSSLENWRWFLAGMGCIIITLFIPVLIAFIQSGKI